MKKIITILLMCITFYACSKKNDSVTNTLPRVSYNLHTDFRNQGYITTHTSISHDITNPVIGFFWDNGPDIGSSQACEALELVTWISRNILTYYQINFIDSPSGPYPSPTRPILSFSIPSLNSISNFTDTSVLINIEDTVYMGHADVSFTITSTLNTSTVQKYVSGNFNVNGRVSNGFTLDSVSFLSTGTFTNMPDIP